MAENWVLFVDKDQELKELYDGLSEFAKYSIKQITLEDLGSEYILGKIKEIKASSLIIIIETSYYSEKKEELDNLLHNCFKIHFSNIIELSPKLEYLQNPDILNSRRYSFFFSAKENITLQATYLNLFINNLFDKFMVQDRLNDYICNSFREVVYSELLAKKNKEINKLNDELERKNRIDNLTNLLNRNALYDFLEKERRRTLRGKWRIENSGLIEKVLEKESGGIFGNKPSGGLLEHFGVFSLLMLDIDYFKKVNDGYGHLMGDSVLKALANLLQKEGIFRNNDVAGRFGGEEFIIILPETNSHHAVEPAKRLLEEFRDIEFVSDEGIIFRVTLSIGISEFYSTDKSNEDIIQRADKALYYAKEHGRNRIVVYEDILQELNE